MRNYTSFSHAQRHIKYTIPPAVALTFLYRPLLNRLDLYKIFFLVTVSMRLEPLILPS